MRRSDLKDCKTLTFMVLVAALVWGGFVFYTFPAQAQGNCDTRENVLKLLGEKYKEQVTSLGVTNSGGLVEVVTTETGSTWSIVVTTPQGKSCLVAAGEGWRSKDYAELEPEA